MTRKQIVNQIIYGLDADADPTGAPTGTIYIQENTIKYYNGSAWVLLYGAAKTETLTNKTFNADGTGNSITNIENADIKANADIVPSKLSAGSNGQEIRTISGTPTWVDAYLDPYEFDKNYIYLFEDFFGGDVYIAAGGHASNTIFTENVSGTSAAWSNGISVQALNDAVGVVQGTTGSTSSGLAAYYPATINWIRVGQGKQVKWASKVRVEDLSTSTQRYTVRTGLMSSNLAGAQADGIYFEYVEGTSNFWRMVCAKDNTRTETDTDITVAADTWYELAFVVNAAGTSVEFFIDGVSKGTVTTNIPTGSADGISPIGGIVKTVGTTARVWYVDYVMMLAPRITPLKF